LYDLLGFMALSTEFSTGEVLASPFRASPLWHHRFLSLCLDAPLKNSQHHWVGPRKSVSNWAPPLLTPALRITSFGDILEFIISNVKHTLSKWFIVGFIARTCQHNVFQILFEN